MQKQQLFYISILLALLTACTGLSKAASKGVDASDDELLATLASLAKRGTTAVCDPAVLEKELGIKFGVFKIDKTPSLAGAPREHQWTEELASNLDGKAFKHADYYRGRGTEGASCQIYIHFTVDRLCNTGSDSVQKIMGESLVLGSPSPHGSSSPYEYHYKPIKGASAVISFGFSEQKCANGFQLTTKGIW
jgi:hypothetical protein